jgi:hypothetical protein
MRGRLELTSLSKKKLLLYTPKGGKKYLSEGKISVSILGKKNVQIKTSSDEKFWKIRFNKSIASFLKRDRVLFGAGEIGQKYDIVLKRIHTFKNSRQEESLIDCMYTVKEWVNRNNGVMAEIDKPTKGKVRAIIKVDTYDEVIKIDFLRPGLRSAIAKFTSNAMIIEKIKVVKELETCRNPYAF